MARNLVHKKTFAGWTTKYIESNFKEKLSSKTISKNVLGISDPTYIVNQAAIIYIKLRDTAILINHSFSLQLLLRITIAFISIVTSLFLIAIRFSKANVSEESQTSINVMFTTWAFFNALNVAGSIWITSATCNEVKIIQRYVYCTLLKVWKSFSLKAVKIKLNILVNCLVLTRKYIDYKISGCHKFTFFVSLPLNFARQSN